MQIVDTNLFKILLKKWSKVLYLSMKWGHKSPEYWKWKITNILYSPFTFNIKREVKRGTFSFRVNENFKLCYMKMMHLLTSSIAIKQWSRISNFSQKRKLLPKVKLKLLASLWKENKEEKDDCNIISCVLCFRVRMSHAV